MRIDPDTGRLRDAPRLRHVDSPNQDDSPEGMVPELIVIHGITLPPGEHGGPWIDQLFTNTLDPAEHPYFAEIAPERKTDPGESFDWERLRRLLKNP